MTRSCDTTPSQRYCGTLALAGLLLIAMVAGCEVPSSSTALPGAGPADSVTTDSRSDSPAERSADATSNPSTEADSSTETPATVEANATPAATDGEASSAETSSGDDSQPADDEKPADEPEAEKTSAEVQVATAGDNEKPVRPFSISRAPTRPGEAEKISFDDLVIGLQADVVFRPWMMGDRPKELDGKKVQIIGYMHGAVENPNKVKEFVLLRNLECKFGPGGQADHLAQVYMKPGIQTRYPGKDSMKVEGTLKIEPFTGADGNTWSLYKIVDAEVVR